MINALDNSPIIIDSTILLLKYVFSAGLPSTLVKTSILPIDEEIVQAIKKLAVLVIPIPMKRAGSINNPIMVIDINTNTPLKLILGIIPFD